MDATTNSISYSTYNQANAASTQTAYGRDSLIGYRAIQMQIHSSFTPGHYWLGFGIKSTIGSGTASWNVIMSHHYKTISQVAYARYGMASSASAFASAPGFFAGAGSYRAQTAAMPGSVILNGSDIKMMNPFQIPVFNISGWETNASNI
jgi:hypothetical protein